jgi:hypothetical protein
VRDTEEGKGRFDLLPFEGLKRVAIHYQNGAKKYEDRNWEKGAPFSRYISAIQRHASQYASGYRDEDHLAAVAWGALALLTFEERIKRGEMDSRLDNLPRRPEVSPIGEAPVQENIGDIAEAGMQEIQRQKEQAAIAQAHNVYNACDVEEAIRWAYPADPEEIRSIWNTTAYSQGCSTLGREWFVRNVTKAILAAQENRGFQGAESYPEEKVMSYAELTETKGGIPTPSKFLVYISGPYRASTPEGIERNVENAARVASEFWNEGYSVICPHLNTHRISQIYPEITGEEYIAGDLTQVDRCDAVVFLPGWSSSEGTMQEMIHAQNGGIPVISWHEIASKGWDYFAECLVSE